MNKNGKSRGQKKEQAAPQGEHAAELGVELNVRRLEKMIKALIDNLERGDLNGKASVGDLLKLLQMYKELTAETIREVEVRWVDRLPKDSESGT